MTPSRRASLINLYRELCLIKPHKPTTASLGWPAAARPTSASTIAEKEMLVF